YRNAPMRRMGPASHHLEQSLGHFGGRGRHSDSGRLESFDLLRRGAFATADDGSRVAHPAPGRGSRAGDKTRNRLFAIPRDPFRGFFFGRPTDLSDHNNPVRIRVGREEFDHVQVRGSIDRVASDANASRLADSTASKLPYRLVGQCAAARDHPDVAAFMDISRRNPNPTTTLIILA